MLARVVLLSFFAVSAFAQSPARRPAQAAPLGAAGGWIKGRVIVDKAAVYKDSDFDSKVLGFTVKGRVFMMLPQTFGAFHRIEIRKGQYGYIPDTEIRPLVAPKAAAKKKADTKTAEKEKKDPPRKKLPFHEAGFRGLSASMINFRENTMGMRPTDTMLFYGFKMSGKDTVMEGSEGSINVDFAPSAPSYYEQATGYSASGFVLLVSGLIEHTAPQGKNTMTFWGFGPMFKYSKFNVSMDVPNAKPPPAKVRDSFAMDNMHLGAAFNLGLAQKIGDFALRAEARYFWEDLQYLGFSVALQKEF